MVTRQRALTILAEIKQPEVENLRTLLKEIGDDVDDSPIIPFAELTTIHYARWVILDGATDAKGGVIPPQLLLSTNYDAPQDRHLEELVRVAGSGRYQRQLLCH